MAGGPTGAVLRQLDRLLGQGSVAGLSEWQLLERYHTQRDEAAFAALVARHGPMVLGVCRRILGNNDDVDDAFQATFLVLVKKAGSLGEHDLIGHWLYGVAHRVALRARTVAAKRRLKQPNLNLFDQADKGSTASPDLGWVLEEELCRLPHDYRALLVLCYLQGMTHEEAARRLQCPLGTVKGRLARARALLKARLVRRGIAPTAGAALATLSQDASAHVPDLLLNSTVDTGMRLATGTLTLEALPAAVALLLPGVYTTMFLTRIKLAAAVGSLIVAGLAGAAVAQYAKEKPGQPGDSLALRAQDSGTKPSKESGQANQPQTGSTDSARANEKVPGGQQTRSTGITLAAFEEKQHDLATKIYKGELQRFKGGESHDLTAIAEWSKLMSETSTGLISERTVAIEQHVARMEHLFQDVQKLVKLGQATSADALKAQFHWLEAEKLLASAKQNPNEILLKRRPDYIPPNQRDVRSQSILKALEEFIDAEFPNETPLEKVLQHIKSSAKGPEFPNGFPIYVNPVGLQEAEKTMTSPVTIDIKGVSIKDVLRLVLKQLGLTYDVHDGILEITSENSEESAPMTPILELADLASRGELSLKEMEELSQKFKLILQIRQFAAGQAPKADQAPNAGQASK